MQYQCYNTEDEQGSCDPHDRGYILDLAGADLQDDPYQESEHDTVRDGVCERHEDHGNESADNIRDVSVEFHLQNGFGHQQSDEDQSRRGSEARDRQEDRGQEQSQNEQNTGGDSSQTGTSASGNACSRLNIARNGRGTESSTDNRTDSIRHQSLAGIRQMAFLVEQVALIRNTDKGADGIEQVNEQERESDDQEVRQIGYDVSKVELEEGRSQRRRHQTGEVGQQRQSVIPADQLCADAKDPSGDDAPKDRAFDLEVIHDGDQNQSDHSQSEFSGTDSTKGHQCGSVVSNDSGTLKSNDNDEKSDTGGDTVFQVRGHGVNKSLTEFEDRKDDKDDTFDQDRSQCDLPGILDPLCGDGGNYGEREVRVQAHSGSQSHRIVCKEAHQNAGECRGNGRSGKDCTLIHAGSGKDTRVDCQDIRH